MRNTVMLAALAALLSACGGGADVSPSVSQIQSRSLRYGQTAVILVGGRYMRADMQVDAGSCSNPSFNSASTPELAILNCKVSAVGPLTVSIKTADGRELHASTLTVLPPQVTLTTSMGDIVLELKPELVAATVDNFLLYVNDGYYQNTLFHRVMAGFVIQGGGYTSGLVRKPTMAPIALQTSLSNLRGTLGMARASLPDSATSEFFINLVDNLALDYKSALSPGYAVFGSVVRGMEVVDAIAAVPTRSLNGAANVPTSDVTITSAFQTQ